MSKNHFAVGGSQYALRRPTYPTELAAVLADACIKVERALDVGCGSGQLSVLLAEHFDDVVATDPSRSQLQHAAKHPKVTYVMESAESIGLSDNSVDLIVAAQAAHWFDLDRFYCEVKRIARPGCVLVLVSYGIPEMTGETGRRFSQFYWQEIHDFWPTGRQHVENGYQSLPFPFDERSLPKMAIRRDWSRQEFLGYVDTWSAVKKVKEAGQMQIVDRFKADLAALWPESETHKVSWPVTGRIATVA